VKQGIEKILDLVSLITVTNTCNNPEVAETNLSTLARNIIQEVENIRQELVRSVFATCSLVEVEFLIQNHQALLIRLLDEVYASKAVSPGNDDSEEIHNSIIDALSGLLFFIEKYFSRYFNIDDKVPLAYYSINKQEFGQQYDRLKNALQEKDVSAELVNILLLKFNATNTNQERESATYRRFIYLKELLNEIVLIQNNPKETDLDFAIEKLLIYLNYNDPAFITYVIANISNTLNSLQNIEDKTLALKFKKKQTSQINSRPGVGLYLELMPAKEQIENWIDEEVNYLLSETNFSKPSTTLGEQVSEPKLSTSLSVPQLAFLIRILVEDKIITNTNQTEVLKFFATHFTTVKRETVSYIHLRSQYYKPISSSIEAIKSMLFKLLNVCRKIA